MLSILGGHSLPKKIRVPCFKEKILSRNEGFFFNFVDCICSGVQLERAGKGCPTGNAGPTAL